jgi:putative hydrolase of the HAD superfamily
VQSSASNELPKNLQAGIVDAIRRLSRPTAPRPAAGVSARLQPLPRVRAVLFDVYGTLFISGSGDISVAKTTFDAAALADALESTGFSGRLQDAAEAGVVCLQQAIASRHAQRRQAGIMWPEVDIREVWREVLQKLRDDRLLVFPSAADTVEYLAAEFECRVNPVWPMPNAAEVLKELARQGRHLGIVSNAQFYTPFLFPALLQEPLTDFGFDPELCAWSYQLLQAKPDPALFAKPLKICRERYGLRPDQVAYVGNDCLNDVWTAGQCGCRTVLFAGDARSLRLREDDTRCREIEPDAVITSLTQIPQLLNHSH